MLAATNRDLETLVSNGQFREDLFYRLNVVVINLPPLRERKEDIPELVSYFVAKYAKKYNKDVRGVTKDVLQILVEYDWPGNVRELENAIARGVIVTSAPLILPEDLPSNLLEGKEVRFTLPYPFVNFAQNTVIRLRKTGYLHNESIAKDLTPKQAHSVWEYMFEKKEQIKKRIEENEKE